MSIRSYVATALAFALLLAPRVAEACAVCMAGKDEANRNAFLLTTGFLSVLPPLLVGGAVWWLRKRSRALQAAEEARALGTAAPAAASRGDAL